MKKIDVFPHIQPPRFWPSLELVPAYTKIPTFTTQPTLHDEHSLKLLKLAS